MKNSRKTGKPAAKKTNGTSQARGRRMEPVKTKETKNQRFDDVDDDEQEPEIIEDDNFKGFDDFYGDDDEDDD
jgi:hypothetical protein